VGVDVPMNQALARLIKEIETGIRKIDGKNMDDLLTA
jgi:hypothetical protein